MAEGLSGLEPASAVGCGILMVVTDLPDDPLGEIDEWYNRRHVPERVPGVPGFRLAARYVSLGAGPAHMAWYETDTPAVLASEPYLQLVRNRDPQTDRILPLFRNTIRTVGLISADIRFGHGSHRTIVPLDVAGAQTTFGDAIAERLLPAVASRRGVVRVALVRRDDGMLASSTQLHARKNDRSYASVLLIDGAFEGAAGVSDDDLDLLRDCGVEPQAPGRYRLTMFATTP